MMNKKTLFKALIGSLVIITIIAGTIFYGSKKTENKKEEKAVEVIKPQQKADLEPVKLVIPESYLLEVPYTVQAPLKNWNIHEESCEEAAILMAHYYLIGSKVVVISPKDANQELINMKKWQVVHLGKEPDLTISGLGKFGQEYYGYQYIVKKSITADDIKLSLSQEHPVMVPVITHALENPNYGPSPSYHILLIKGYDATGVIANDAGISQGRNRRYTWKILWQAIDAQTAQMKQGRDMLIITK